MLIPSNDLCVSEAASCVFPLARKGKNVIVYLGPGEEPSVKGQGDF